MVTALLGLLNFFRISKGCKFKAIAAGSLIICVIGDDHGCRDMCNQPWDAKAGQGG